MVLEVNATLTINEAILGRRDLPEPPGKSPQKAAQEVLEKITGKEEAGLGSRRELSE